MLDHASLEDTGGGAGEVNGDGNMNSLRHIDLEEVRVDNSTPNGLALQGLDHHCSIGHRRVTLQIEEGIDTRVALLDLANEDFRVEAHCDRFFAAAVNHTRRPALLAELPIEGFALAFATFQ